MKTKTERPYALTPKQHAYLERMAAAHGLSDAGKALRCLVAFAMASPEREEELFEVVRCADPSECPEGSRPDAPRG